MADAFIQVPVDAGGKKVETTELTRPDGVVVERQRFEIPGNVTIDGDIIRQLLVEARLQTAILAQAFGITDDLNQLRADVASTDHII